MDEEVVVIEGGRGTGDVQTVDVYERERERERVEESRVAESRR